jgi:predicted nucleotidyltransferase
MTLDFNLETIRTVCRKNDIAQLALFGSFVRGSERDDSDIDLLVQFSRPKSLLGLLAAQRELSEALNRPVDLVTEPSLSPT